MWTPLPPLLLLLAAAAAAIPTALAAPNCPPQGAVFEKPRNFKTSAAIRDAIANLTASFTARDSDNSAAVLASNVSYSVEIFSTAADAPSVFSWHHTAPTLNATVGVKKADGDAVYRLGSLTKIFTVYTWLAQDGDSKWSDPITKYVPELAAAADKAASDPLSNVAWGDVTIGALTSQLSGAVRDYGLMGEITQEYDQNTAVAVGFPPLSSSDPTFPKCGAYPLCNRTAFFAGLLQTHPSYAPFVTPAYTNTGFQILAYALESIKGKPFKTLLQESVLTPLKLQHTYYNNAPARAGLIPGGSTTAAEWDYQLGDESPAGNMYSSASDISALGRSILSSSLLSPTLTNRWLKPAALTSETVAGVGYPWGIRRIPRPLSNGKRTVDAYVKAGRIGYYSSLLSLLPDYGVGITIVMAGSALPGNSNFNIADAVGEILLPALEAAAREQADAIYAGTYVDKAHNSSLKITTQTDRPGLGIENWVSNGTDMQGWSVVLQSGYAPVQPSIRLYPTGLETNGGKRKGYKAVFEDLSLPSRAGSMFSTDCGSWVSFTAVMYGGQALDQFVFVLDGSGKVVGLENAALRSVLTRV
ncbi:beta-lactamase/transpeptidase-like protein [Podospora appendiculata]|uniref:Beta-lactamase/transpeptidase-like protein n=1 Tax=Podospora appendiculata TaxID=314037 RepID=A0AAE0XI00_9PEZI|nr:beta-lactamase/transpeptidase-like protein [Podospora appendiculata]